MQVQVQEFSRLFLLYDLCGVFEFPTKIIAYSLGDCLSIVICGLTRQVVSIKRVAREGKPYRG